jgi:hypothetical protein
MEYAWCQVCSIKGMKNASGKVMCDVCRTQEDEIVAGKRPKPVRMAAPLSAYMEGSREEKWFLVYAQMMMIQETFLEMEEAINELKQKVGIQEPAGS